MSLPDLLWVLAPVPAQHSSPAPATAQVCPDSAPHGLQLPPILWGAAAGPPPSTGPGRRAPGCSTCGRGSERLGGFHKQGLLWAGRANLDSAGCVAGSGSSPAPSSLHNELLPISERALPHAAGQLLPAPSGASGRPLRPGKWPGTVSGGCQRPCSGVPLGLGIPAQLRGWGRQSPGWPGRTQAEPRLARQNPGRAQAEPRLAW